VGFAAGRNAWILGLSDDQRKEREENEGGECGLHISFLEGWVVIGRCGGDLG
jgi:hypothetical protein